MSKKRQCKMCDKMQDLENLEFDECSKEYFCKYPYHSDLKSCIEQQYDYYQFLHDKEPDIYGRYG